jgi:hypothetical protein
VRNRARLAAGLAAALVGAGPALAMPSMEVGRGEGGPDLGYKPRGWSGRHRSQRMKRNRIQAYKEQRAANRLRRKLEARRG